MQTATLHYRGACLLTLLIVINSWENWEMCWDRIEGLMIIFNILLFMAAEFSLNCSFIKNCMSLACLKRSVEIDMHAYIHTVHTHTHTHTHTHIHTHTHTHMSVYIYICIYMYDVWWCMHACMNINLHRFKNVYQKNVVFHCKLYNGLFFHFFYFHKLNI